MVNRHYQRPRGDHRFTAASVAGRRPGRCLQSERVPRLRSTGYAPSLAGCSAWSCGNPVRAKAQSPVRATGAGTGTGVGITPRLVPAARHGVPAPPARECAAVTCESAGRCGSGRCGGRGEPRHGRCRRAVRPGERARLAPAGAAAGRGSVSAPTRCPPRGPRSPVPPIRRKGLRESTGGPRNDREWGQGGPDRRGRRAARRRPR